MYDLGEKWGTTENYAEKVSKKEEKHYPHEIFSVKMMPELSGKKVGDKVKLVFMAEIVSITKRQNDREDKEEYIVELKKGTCQSYEEDVSFFEKKKRIANMFNTKNNHRDDFDEDISRPKVFQGKAHRFSQQLNTN